MLYRKNMGPTQRWARFVAGGAMVVCSFVLAGSTPLGWLMAGAGVVTGLTGVFGYCPACAMAVRPPAKDPR